MTPSQLHRFAAQAAAQRASLWGAVFTVSTDAQTPKRQLHLAASPATHRRVFSEQRTGWIQIVERTILVPREFLRSPHDHTFPLGAVLTCLQDQHHPANNGTLWSVKALSDPNAGTELKLTVWRVDS